MDYRAPWWLPGGHAQTIWSALYARQRRLPARALQRERWRTLDGDFIDIDRQPASAAARPMLVMFHGLEGSSRSHYAQACADWAAEHDVHWVMPHFRGCSGEINRAPRAYHSGDHEEIDWIVQRLRAEHLSCGGDTLVTLGISLGGNALMRWAGEQGASARQCVDAAAAICAPLDLTASGQAMGRGLNRQVYTRMFLRTMKPKALAKLQQYPDLFSRQRLMRARDLYAFDDVFTAPLHGFKGAEDYWRRASAKPLLTQVQVPALLVNPLNDPFVPAHSLPQRQDVSPMVTLWQPPHGGHVGFAAGRWPGQVRGLADRVGQWLLHAAAQDKELTNG